jgi:hypothetical protein
MKDSGTKTKKRGGNLIDYLEDPIDGGRRSWSGSFPSAEHERGGGPLLESVFIRRLVLSAAYLV